MKQWSIRIDSCYIDLFRDVKKTLGIEFSTYIRTNNAGNVDYVYLVSADESKTNLSKIKSLIFLSKQVSI